MWFEWSKKRLCLSNLINRRAAYLMLSNDINPFTFLAPKPSTLSLQTSNEEKTFCFNFVSCLRLSYSAFNIPFLQYFCSKPPLINLQNTTWFFIDELNNEKFKERAHFTSAKWKQKRRSFKSTSLKRLQPFFAMHERR